MNVFGIIAHLSLLIHMGKDLQGIVNNLIQKKETFPSKEEFLALLEDAAQLLSSGLIGLPDTVVKQMVDAIAMLKTQI